MGRRHRHRHQPEPRLQPDGAGQRFDPDGEYVRRYVPELAALRGAAIHDPDAAVRRACDYPEPIVDHHDGDRRLPDGVDTSCAE